MHTEDRSGPVADVSPTGWLKRQVTDDALDGWVQTCEHMSREGIMQMDPNSGTIVPYFMPFDKWYQGGRRVWTNSVPYYQTLIDKTGAFGEGEFQGHWLDALVRFGWTCRDRILIGNKISGLNAEINGECYI